MKRKIFLSIILLPAMQVFSQSVKDTIHLQEVNIFASLFKIKDNIFTSGKKIQEIDSGLKQIYALNNLSEILNYQSSLFVKNYAPGSISSTSVRGGNAQQTMLLWNGININHPMLGQADLSQLTTSIFDNLSIEYGAASSLWGSPAMNGAIRLENHFTNKDFLNLKYKYQSFQTHQILIKTALSRKKYNFYFNQSYNTSQNNYPINDSIKLKNASYSNISGNTGIQFSIDNKLQIQVHSWLNVYNRFVPNNYFFNQYAAKQHDKNWRNLIECFLKEKTFRTGVKVAYIFDELNYRDSLVRIYSYSKVHSIQTEENIYKDFFSENIQWIIGHQWIYNYAITNNYLENATMNRHSVFTGIQQSIKKFSYNIIIRKEWANIASDIPFTGNIGIEYQAYKTIKLKLSSSKNYRLPTMNDLYWKGSGDISIKPEDGYEYEGGIVIKLKIPQWHSEFYTEATAFSRYTNNWIMWLPGGNGNPVPANISKVWSRGTETNNYWLFQFHQFKTKLSINSAYILSTIEQSKINNDASIGRQLIYTPRYNINGFIHLIYKNWFLTFTHQYVGYRFTSSDNLQWLDPYHISNISFGKNIRLKNADIQLFSGVNNLFNTPYTIIAQRPMPLRHYFIQINFCIPSKKQTIN